MKQIFIDQFTVPSGAELEFKERMKVNRDFIKKLDGFIEDRAYERHDDQGNLICITTAIWQNEDVLQKAKEAVQQLYRQQGFDMKAMLQRLNISMERNTYQAVTD
ncbi:antibiotic biosynthesis monooxygenase [Mucilaginibacter endophyticus]|uniref:antibiotic biosynthesis monooxygenase n=1 Tax=Mucilaginibacter endophyticus TaxID=2675003 RepID=UPI000E0CCC30|nr:antibiotic biosynthesis monooxygenase [Mucilaginibacter endophyticus]